MSIMLIEQIDIQAGLIDEWKWKTWLRMKEEAHAKGDVLDIQEDPAVAPLSFDEIQSPMLLVGFSFALCALVFVLEIMSTCWRSNKKVS